MSFSDKLEGETSYSLACANGDTNSTKRNGLLVGMIYFINFKSNFGTTKKR